MPAAPLPSLLAAGVCFLVIWREWKGCNRDRSFSVEHSPQASTRKPSETTAKHHCLLHCTHGPHPAINVRPPLLLELVRVVWGIFLRPTISTLQVLTLLRPSLSPSQLQTLLLQILTGTRAKRMQCPTSQDDLSTFLRCTRNLTLGWLVGPGSQRQTWGSKRAAHIQNWKNRGPAMKPAKSLPQQGPHSFIPPAAVLLLPKVLRLSHNLLGKQGHGPITKMIWRDIQYGHVKPKRKCGVHCWRKFSKQVHAHSTWSRTLE